MKKRLFLYFGIIFLAFAALSLIGCPSPTGGGGGGGGTPSAPPPSASTFL